MSKKPSFANLGARLAQKPIVDPSAMSAPPGQKTRVVAVTPVEADAGIRQPRQLDGRRGILVRARPEAWKALKQIALDNERTLQDVMTEAINDILMKNEKSPLA